VEIKFVRRKAKYTWEDYKTNDDILSENEINPTVNKFQNYRNKLIRHVQRIDRDRLPHLIVKYQPCEKRSQGRPLKRLPDC
jgi:hypothetical protein